MHAAIYVHYSNAKYALDFWSALLSYGGTDEEREHLNWRNHEAFELFLHHFVSSIISNASCERGFSIKKIIEYILRNRLSADRIKSIMMIKINGQKCGEKPFIEFKKMATQHIHKCGRTTGIAQPVHPQVHEEDEEVDDYVDFEIG